MSQLPRRDIFYTTTKMTWTRTDDELFEAAVANLGEDDDPERWRKIVAEVPGKSPDEIRAHYEALVHDVILIDSGRVELPVYSDSWPDSPRSGQISFGSGHGNKVKQSDVERKKGTPWTEEEHRYFQFFLHQFFFFFWIKWFN